jgi:hypothetical protein
MAASMLVAQASGLPDAMQARTLHHSMNMSNVDCGRSPDRATKRIGDLWSVVAAGSGEPSRTVHDGAAYPQLREIGGRLHMASDTSASGAEMLREPEDFSLVLGGPLFQLLRRSPLSGNALELVRRRLIRAACAAGAHHDVAG